MRNPSSAERDRIAGTPALSFARWQAGGYAQVRMPRAADPARLQSLSGQTMGTHWSLRLDNPRMLPRGEVCAAVEAVLADVVAQMSHWVRDSALGRFNDAPPGSWHALPEGLAQVLGRALHWAKASGGAFDPTLGALVAAWGFGPDASAASEWPDARTLATARERCGWHRLDLRGDGQARSARQPGGLRLDLSGIAKGHAVDRVAEALTTMGLRDFLFEIGGELIARGQRPDGQPWRVQVAAAATDAQVPLLLPLRDEAVATSGDHWHVREHAGRRWSHTLDPRTGEPVGHALAAVTVVHPTCMDADALSTLLTVMGPEEGLAFADLHQVAALFTERKSDGTLRRLASRCWRFGIGANS
ncbi:MAG: FAD:protein FMN transferase [Herbaspirillum sp.]